MLHLNWISSNHNTQWFELFSWPFAVIILTESFPFSTHPCTQGFFAFALTNLHSPGHHASIVSTISLFPNSLSLSEYKMYGKHALLQPKNHLPCLFWFHRKKDMKFSKMVYNVTHSIKITTWYIAKDNQVNL